MISCDLDDPPAYTTRDSEDHAVGDSVVYSCSNDTWFGPGTKAMIFECTGNGEWSPSLRPCECKSTLCNNVSIYKFDIHRKDHFGIDMRPTTPGLIKACFIEISYNIEH